MKFGKELAILSGKLDGACTQLHVEQNGLESDLFTKNVFKMDRGYIKSIWMLVLPKEL